jgi:adenylate cyclase
MPRLKSVFRSLTSARSIGLLITALVLAAYFVGVPLLDLLELKTYDMRLQSSTPATPPAQVAIVAIDEESLSKIGRWPWSRRTVAQLIERLDQLGVQAIALDVFFSEPENRPLLDEIDRLERAAAPGATAAYARLRASLNTDAALERAIRNSGKVVLPMVFLWSEADTRHQRAGDTERILKEIAAHSIADVPASGDQNPLLRTPEPKGVLANLPGLQAAARAIGHINVTPDADGTVRRVPLVVRYQGRFYPDADLQAVRLLHGQPELVVNTAPYGIAGLSLAGRPIYTDEEGQALVRYYGAEGTVPTVSAADVLRGGVDAAQLRGRVVLIGATAKGIGDIRVTPYGPVFPGVEIRATVTQNILDGAFIHRPEWLQLVEIPLLLALGIILTLALPRLGVRLGSLISLLVLAGYFAAATAMFQRNIWISVVYPSLLIVLLFMSTTLVQYFRSELEKRQIKSAFQHYVSSKVVDEIMHDVSKLRLGGEKRDLTVLFSDIRGFTSMSEQMAPEDLVRLLNSYLTRMTENVFQNDGLLDKYIGDAIMAIYGAPIYRADHAVLACRTALEMMTALFEMQAEWRRHGSPVLDIGIGINSGPMIVGNMGSQARFDYTVIGDAVNLGSRIESMNKDYGTHILLSEYTYQYVRDAFRNLREVHVANIRGRGARVRLYELIPDGVYPNLDWLDEFARGYTLYHSERRKEALPIFQALSENVHDPVSQYYLRREQHPLRRSED